MICLLALLALSGFLGGLAVDFVKAKAWFRDNVWPWLRG